MGSLTLPDKARRRDGRESIAAQGAKNSGVKPGELLKDVVDRVLVQIEPMNQMLEQLEKGAIAQGPDALRVTRPTETPELGGAQFLQRT